LESEEEIEDGGELVCGPGETDGQGNVSEEPASETKVNHLNCRVLEISGEPIPLWKIDPN
jgi:hypothetical protein